jgi:glycosyltransferase involved in cell wall biosynthesis
VSDGEVLVGTTANYTALKAYPDLLEAAHRLVEKGLPVRFVAMGQGPLEQEIRRVHASLGLGDRFLLLGYQQDVPRVLSACDVFVLASLNEGLPLALMEALAMGLPIVATSVGGIPEGVSDGVEALLVPPSRPELLAGALETLVRDPQMRRRMAEASLARGEYFHISRAVGELEAVYGRMIAGRPG